MAKCNKPSCGCQDVEATFIPSELKAKASKKLEEEIQKELSIPDPEKSIAEDILSGDN